MWGTGFAWLPLTRTAMCMNWDTSTLLRMRARRKTEKLVSYFEQLSIKHSSRTYRFVFIFRIYQLLIWLVSGLILSLKLSFSLESVCTEILILIITLSFWLVQMIFLSSVWLRSSDIFVWVGSEQLRLLTLVLEDVWMDLVSSKPIEIRFPPIS